MSDSWPRRRLLAILRGAGEPLDAQELARVTGQHVTTVRFHLDVLTRESLVRQFQQPPRGRGRPRIGYAAVQHSVGYQDLAQVLADQLGSDPQRRTELALAAGRAWGARVDQLEQPITSLEQAREVTTTVSSELGFAPERDLSSETEQQVSIRLTACPLRELARTHSEVVCGVHQGLLREILDRNGGRDVVDAQLQPFAEPDLCVVHMQALAGDLRPDPAEIPDPGADVPPLRSPSANRVGPQLRSTEPQLRNADAHNAQQATQQW
ncbi:helix-turn-helix transcriptional regulator [Nocardia vermiculata]|uniref:Transcriptional regulator n=1 Tax=Nocardia vermiculata TaxID=257274 RepID=A0A846XZV8_9NOCA|nr:transcriptional regulator [Nocardia vermiculata]NKY50578.1 transcriptional regulator [Nocardia vermiculata]